MTRDTILGGCGEVPSPTQKLGPAYSRSVPSLNERSAIKRRLAVLQNPHDHIDT